MMSTKKRDTMLQRAAGGVNPSPDANTIVGQNVTISATAADASQTHQFIFCPTYRFLQPSNAEYKSMRTSQKIFLKGYSERFELIPNDGSTWWWRRIIYSYKAPMLPTVAIMASIGAQTDATSSSYRQMRDLSGQTGAGPYATAQDTINEVLFQGTLGVDWNNPFNAKVDTSRVTLLSDTRVNLASGNALARPRVIKKYTPINKSLKYDDEENGLQITPSPLSVQTKEGVGNIYVLDFFVCPAPSDPVLTQLRIDVNSTLYWHEK